MTDAKLTDGSKRLIQTTVIEWQPRKKPRGFVGKADVVYNGKKHRIDFVLNLDSEYLFSSHEEGVKQIADGLILPPEGYDEITASIMNTIGKNRHRIYGFAPDLDMPDDHDAPAP